MSGTQFKDEPNEYLCEMYKRLTGETIKVTARTRSHWVAVVQKEYDKAQRKHMRKLREAVHKSYQSAPMVITPVCSPQGCAIRTLDALRDALSRGWIVTSYTEIRPPSQDGPPLGVDAGVMLEAIKCGVVSTDYPVPVSLVPFVGKS